MSRRRRSAEEDENGLTGPYEGDMPTDDGKPPGWMAVTLSFDDGEIEEKEADERLLAAIGWGSA